MLDEFKKFILKGNVVDLATGVIIGAAFTGIVTSFTKGIVEPLLALAGGGPTPKLAIPLTERMVTVKEMVAGKEVEKSVSKLIELDLGGIIGALISFLITAAIIFFVIVKPANALITRIKTKEASAPPPGPSEEVKLLTEICQLLRTR